jgi:hypothetical protein
MVLKSLTVHLPEPLYERVKETAAATDRSLEEVAEQLIALSVPPLEDDLSPQLRNALAALNLMSDDQLWRIARSQLAEGKHERFEVLIDARKERDLTIDEEKELEALSYEANLIMLQKAESYRLLTRRGYTIPWLNR